MGPLTSMPDWLSAGGRVEELKPVEDVVGPGLRLLIVGINPGRKSARTGHHFAGPGNRFWPALHLAGITPTQLAPSEGGELIERGVGITNLVPRMTARADELELEELRRGATRLVGLVHEHQPRAVALLGLVAFRRAFARPRATAGLQPERCAGAQWWLLANPSGLNAAMDVAAHAAGLAAAAREAGVLRAEHGSP